jgi:hypothetical protein
MLASPPEVVALVRTDRHHDRAEPDSPTDAGRRDVAR